jgi:hypothetical protein
MKGHQVGALFYFLDLSCNSLVILDVHENLIIRTLPLSLSLFLNSPPTFSASKEGDFSDGIE